MTGSIAPNCPGHHGTVVARTVGTVAISCNDGLSWRQPILGVHMLSMTHREAAIYDDACTVPTPCLLLPDSTYLNPDKSEQH